MIDPLPIVTCPDVSGQWSTSSFGGTTDTSPADLASLGKHLRLCSRQRGRLFALKCAGDAVADFAAPRFVTTLVLIASVVAVVLLLN